MCGQIFFLTNIFFTVSTLHQHLVFNGMNKHDFTLRGTSWLTDRHTQNYTVKSTFPRRAALLGTY